MLQISRMKISHCLTVLTILVGASMSAPPDLDSVKIITSKPKDSAPIIKSEDTEKNEIMENESKYS